MNGARLASLSLAVCLSLASVAPAAATSALKPVVEIPPDRVLRPESLQSLDALRQRARSEGSVRVIVGFRTGTLPPSGGSAADDEARRQAVLAVQQRVFPALEPHLRGEGPYFYTRFEYIPFVALSLDEQGIDALLEIDEVMLFEEESVGDIQLSTSIPQIHADAAHASGHSGSGQTVAILDTGIETSHSFFESRVVSEACYSTSEPPQDPICSHGPYSPSTASGSGGPCTVSGCDHGTWVAGPAAGSGTSMSGVAKSASIISIQVRSLNSSGTVPRIVQADVISALERVYALRTTYSIAAANMSFALSFTEHATACDSSFPSVASATGLLVSAGIAPVAAAGNGGPAVDGLYPPACIANVISAGAVDSDDEKAPYSRGGSLLDYFAPGGNTSSSGLTTSAVGGGFGQVGGGTSMAAPHVTGALAVLRGRFPSATIADMKSQLAQTGPLVAYAFGSETFETPRIDLEAAIHVPAQPASAAVTWTGCFGWNDVTWSAVTSGSVTHYVLQGSGSTSFTSPTVYHDGPGTFAFINVGGTTYLRVRACNATLCGDWREASGTAQYQPVCH
jgi:subtilisin family serine protease